MATVDFDDLELAFSFVSSGPNGENRAYVSLDTGRIYWVSDEEPDLPEDLEDSDRYVAVQKALRERCAENGLEVMTERRP